jgi:hypothetical protein
MDWLVQANVSEKRAISIFRAEVTHLVTIGHSNLWETTHRLDT